MMGYVHKQDKDWKSPYRISIINQKLITAWSFEAHKYIEKCSQSTVKTPFKKEIVTEFRRIELLLELS